MRSITAYGAKDLRLEEHADPKPGPGEVLVHLERGGICGSDLHYFHHGGFGTVRLREPMILGHEVAGRIADVGDQVTRLEKGQRVAVSPSRPCGQCRFCLDGQQNHCLHMAFYGSAMPFPHVQGAFRDLLVARSDQCVPADDLTSGAAAMAEPLSVVLHAARIAGDLLGKRVLVTGCGPIGLLAVCVAEAAGALEIAATDITDFTLEKARQVGATHTINTGNDPQGLLPYTAEKGHFDVLFECSGVSAALGQAVPALRPGAVIVQLGLGGDMNVPMQALTAKEICLKGSFRFHHEFPKAVDMMRTGRLDVSPLITHVLTMDDAVAAFELASDRKQAIKVHLDFES